MSSDACTSRRVRRRIVSGSDSDEDSYPLVGQEIVDKRENEIRYLLSVIPEVTLTEVYDLFTETNFDVQVSLEELKRRYQIEVEYNIEDWTRLVKLGIIKPRADDSTPKATNGVKRPRDESENEEDDDDEEEEDDDDADDDDDVNFEMQDTATIEKKIAFLDFVQNATLQELLLVQTCSKRRAEAIIECRPFKGWDDMLEKMENHKYLSSELVQYIQTVISTRSSVKALMKKCTKLASQLESVLKREGAMKEQPSIITKSLKLTSYQLAGLTWLTTLHEHKVNGILADEMGLGKTIQVIAFIAYLKEHAEASSVHLIVVPVSTLENWKNEFRRWCPYLRVITYYGNGEMRREYRSMFARQRASIDVMLTTYNVVAGAAEDRKFFKSAQLHYVVFDEAHMLKNMNTQRYENLSKIAATQRILLTGTPLQNNLLELMSLLIFVMPGIFSSKVAALKSLFQKCVKQADEEEDKSSFAHQQIKQAKWIMRPFVLRRLKNDVLPELPEKIDHKWTIPMEVKQARLYVKLVNDFKTATKSESQQYSAMHMMSSLRKVANHSLLMRHHYTEKTLRKIAKYLASHPDYKDTVVEYILADLMFMSDFAIHTLVGNFPGLTNMKLGDSMILRSGKFQHLDETLPKLKAGGHRVLIFSQYVIMLNIMESYMDLRNYSFLRLDGGTPLVQRQAIIDEFTENKSIFIFLLSTRAGGLGINLTAADTVIIHDIDFNPYNDKQAEDRCHRLGQSKPVQVYRLVSSDTIEEAMWDVTQEKLKLERDITSKDMDNTDVKSVVHLLSSALNMDQSRLKKVFSAEKKSYSTNELS